MREVVLIAIILLFQITFSATIEKDFGNGFKIIIDYENEKYLNSSSKVSVKGSFRVINISSNQEVQIYNEGSNIIVNVNRISYLPSLVVSSKTFEINFTSFDTPVGTYNAQVNLTVNYACGNQNCTNSTLFDITLYVSNIEIRARVIPTVGFLFEEAIYTNSTNYISIISRLYPKAVRGINLKAVGSYACDDINYSGNDVIYLEYEPKKIGDCIINIEASFEKDGVYFFNSTEISLIVFPYYKKVSESKNVTPEFNITPSKNYFEIYENENATLEVFIEVNIPQNFSVKVNISNVNYVENFEVLNNKTLNFTFYNLSKGIYFVELNFTSNYSLSKSLIITLNVSKYINLTYYSKEYERIQNLIKEKNLENNQTISEKLNLLGEILKNLTAYKTENYENEFKNVLNEIEELIAQASVKSEEEVKEETTEAKEGFPIIIIIIIVVIVIAVAIIFFLFIRKGKSYFDYKRKKYVWKPEEEEIWKKLKEKWMKK